MRNEHALQDAASDPGALDEGALECLFVDCERTLFNVVYRWTWDREDASEIVQEAFARLWSMRTRVDRPKARALLFRIALNLAASRRRWKRVRRFVGLEEAGGSDAAPLAEDALMQQQRSRRVQAAMGTLPEPLRRTLVLCEMTALTHEEIAKILGTRPGTVGSRRHAALARLRHALHTGGDDAHA